MAMGDFDDQWYIRRKMALENAYDENDDDTPPWYERARRVVKDSIDRRAARHGSDPLREERTLDGRTDRRVEAEDGA